MKKEEKLKELREQKQKEEKGIADTWNECKQIVNNEECNGDTAAKLKGVAGALLLRIWDLREVERAIGLLESIED